MAGRRKRHEDEHIDETWLIPYADLLTLLLALFIVLFASSTITEKKFVAIKETFSAIFSGGPSVLNHTTFTDSMLENIDMTIDVQLEQMKQQFDSYIKENKIDGQVKTSLTKDSLKVTILDQALFDSGSAEIKPEARSTIVSIADILLKYPDCEVVISGHTDNVPIHNAEFETNWDLSSARALNCMKLILQHPSLDPRLFSAIGYGEYRPVATNATDEGRTKNRRVEITIKHTNISTTKSEYPNSTPSNGP